MNLNVHANRLGIFTLFLMLILSIAACKKDEIIVNQEKRFTEVDFQSNQSNPYNGGWALTLLPGGLADIAPGGDVIYRGTYKINGKNITVKTDQFTFKFDIRSETEIKEKKYGIILRLNP